MNLAYTMTQTTGDLDRVLYDLANILADAGWKTAGVVQVNSDREDCHACDMDVQVLPDGPVIRISQFLGKEAKGCRLDPAALETAVEEVAKRLGEGVDVLIINKFGKHEADGRGFRNAIAQAIGHDIPVIAGVNTLNLAAFMEFSEGTAVQIDAEATKLVEWLETTKTVISDVA